MKRKQGVYEYHLLSAHKEPDEAEYVSIGLGKFDSDEEAISAAGKYKISATDVIVRVIARASASFTKEQNI